VTARDPKSCVIDPAVADAPSGDIAVVLRHSVCGSSVAVRLALLRSVRTVAVAGGAGGVGDGVEPVEGGFHAGAHLAAAIP
jgi:hypothetical protein